MLLLVTGSSGSGKTRAAAALGAVSGLAVHDSDEHGVPSDADAAWRQRDLERWVGTAVELEHEGTDLLLTGQSPLGELLASPSSPRLSGLACLLLDVDDGVRRRRLAARDPGRWSREEVGAFVGWARWHRGHAADPRDRPEVLITAGAPEMRWDRWTGWRAGDPRWSVTRLDTTDRSVATTAAALREWVDAVRADRRAGTLPLRAGWEESPVGP